MITRGKGKDAPSFKPIIAAPQNRLSCGSSVPAAAAALEDLTFKIDRILIRLDSLSVAQTESQSGLLALGSKVDGDVVRCLEGMLSAQSVTNAKMVSLEQKVDALVVENNNLKRLLEVRTSASSSGGGGRKLRSGKSVVVPAVEGISGLPMSSTSVDPASSIEPVVASCVSAEPILTGAVTHMVLSTPITASSSTNMLDVDNYVPISAVSASVATAFSTATTALLNDRVTSVDASLPVLEDGGGDDLVSHGMDVLPAISLSAAVRRTWVYVSNLPSSTKSAEVCDFIRGRFKVRDPRMKCISLVKRSTSNLNDLDFISFKVGILNHDLAKVLNLSQWPDGIIVRKFVEHSSIRPKNV